jgi:hypothetical protein
MRMVERFRRWLHQRHDRRENREKIRREYRDVGHSRHEHADGERARTTGGGPFGGG